MKNHHRNYLKAFSILCLIMLSTSCSEDFLDRFPRDAPSPAGFFIDEESAKKAVTAIYNPWVSSQHTYDRDLIIMFDAMTDDSYWRPSRAASIQQDRWDITATNPAIVAYWQLSYQSINAANFAIEGIPTCTSVAFTEEQRNNYIGEARFMRGFAYLFLTTLYGDIPKIDHTRTSFDEFNEPRSPREEIHNLIIEDFTFAKDHLPEAWPPSYNGRPTKATGASFLAKAYLFKGDFANAETAAREAVQIAESTGYELVDDYMSIFDEDDELSSEILFSIMFVHNHPELGQNATVQRNTRLLPPEFRDMLGESWGYALPQRDLYDEYEPGDPRRGYTIHAPGDPFGAYIGSETVEFEHEIYDEGQGEFVKYTKTYNPGDLIDYDYRWSETGMNVRKLTADVSDLGNIRWSGLDMPVMRIADLYLILAEALAEQDDPEALDWVNKVRARPSVNMPARIVADGDLVDIVRHERRVELAMEGLRLFDIMRWKNLGDIFGDGTKVKRHFYSDVLTAHSTRFDDPDITLPKHYLFPIPQTELDLNQNLNENNPGY